MLIEVIKCKKHWFIHIKKAPLYFGAFFIQILKIVKKSHILLVLKNQSWISRISLCSIILNADLSSRSPIWCFRTWFIKAFAIIPSFEIECFSYWLLQSLYCLICLLYLLKSLNLLLYYTLSITVLIRQINKSLI